MGVVSEKPETTPIISFSQWNSKRKIEICRRSALVLDNFLQPTGEAGKWMYFDMVPEQYEIREGAPEYTGKVVVIGADLKEDALKEAFVG